MDKEIITRRFTKAIGSYPHESRVQQQIAGKMTRLLQQYLPPRPFRQIVEFGCGTGTYSRILLHSLRPEHLLLNDICEGMEGSCRDILDNNRRTSFVPGDAETLTFPQGAELITSCSALQWFERPDKFFGRCSQALNAHGYFAFSTFGQENMKEIRLLTGQGLSYLSKKELERALHPYYNILHSEEEIISLPFRTPMEVLYHLKKTGVNGTARTTWTRSKLSHFCSEYERLFATGKDSVSLTYHPIYIIAKKKEA